MWPPRWVIRWRFLTLFAAAVVFGGAGLLLGPLWAAAGVVVGPLAAFSASIVVLIRAKPDPGRYNPVLADALLQQAGLLADLSRHGEALGAAQAAIQIYRDLAAADRGTYLPDLALALTRP